MALFSSLKIFLQNIENHLLAIFCSSVVVVKIQTIFGLESDVGVAYVRKVFD